MLEFLLMLLGLAFPNSDANTVSSDLNQVTIENTQTANDNGYSSIEGDTGGEEAHIPPKR